MTPVLFLPGVNCTGALFAAQTAAFAPDRITIVAAREGGETIADFAAAALSSAPGPVVLVAHSMGGYVAFDILRRAPERVAGLVLVGVSARPDDDRLRERRAREIAIAEAGRFRHLLARQAELVLAPSAVGRLGPTVRAMAEAAGAEAFVRDQRAILARSDDRPGLPGIAVPTLAIVGADDRVTPPDRAGEIVAAVPDSTLAVIPGAGHFAPIERPAPVTAAIAAFLARHGL